MKIIGIINPFEENHDIFKLDDDDKLTHLSTVASLSNLEDLLLNYSYQNNIDNIGLMCSNSEFAEGIKLNIMQKEITSYNSNNKIVEVINI